MTPLKKPVTRITIGALEASFGSDKNKRLVVTLIGGNGSDVPDTISIRPERTRRAEVIAVRSIYRIALMNRINCARLEKGRAKKAKNDATRKTRKLEAEVRRHSRENT